LPETVALVSTIEEPSLPKIPPPSSPALLPETVALVSTIEEPSLPKIPPP
jgi:hypothetical protein